MVTQYFLPITEEHTEEGEGAYRYKREWWLRTCQWNNGMRSPCQTHLLLVPTDGCGLSSVMELEE